jgi:hypothetical protein
MNRFMVATGVAVALASATAALALDTFTITYQDPGVQNTTAGFDVVGVETFDARALGFTNFTTDFGTGGAITGVYTGAQIYNPDLFGGAGGVGHYAVTFSDVGYSIDLTADPLLVPNGINYFGYWLSALDSGNVVDFYRAGVLVGSLDPSGVIARIGGCPDVTNAYCGNPNAAFAGQDAHEPFAFVNFYDTNGTFDKIVFRESPQVGGYESDNHTVGYYTTITGRTVPEPASWALMITGFAMVGMAMRRRALAIG